MYLAIMINPEQPCPPPGYGGIERQAAVWVPRLMAKGHKVDLYAGPGSTCPATNLFMAKQPSMLEEANLANEVCRRGSRYDCVIEVTGNHILGQVQTPFPTVSLMLGDPHKLYNHDTVKNRIYGSRELADFYGCPDHPVLNNVIHNDPKSIPLGDGSGGYALYVGTIRPEKGVKQAAVACALAGIPFVVYGPIQPRFMDYWDSFKDQCDYRGILKAGPERWDVFGNAVVFLHLVQFLDCDPLAPKEAMACGTPVIALANGGVCTSVDDQGGVLLQQGAEWLGDVVYHLRDPVRWNRKAIREWILPKVDPDMLMGKLLGYCERATEGEVW